ncbi:hypothetical protein PR048_008252 [Dryococelus australis]|uniref:Uncharacterized protein n=1 Tax=Dryococelus australis TaxID=614101 RepID=A0ABQ9HXH4_9NEOP|nr:hypothetical protein PR048_008252 [Dryococelus australis]
MGKYEKMPVQQSGCTVFGTSADRNRHIPCITGLKEGCGKMAACKLRKANAGARKDVRTRRFEEAVLERVDNNSH